MWSSNLSLLEFKNRLSREKRHHRQPHPRQESAVGLRRNKVSCVRGKKQWAAYPTGFRNAASRAKDIAQRQSTFLACASPSITRGERETKERKKDREVEKEKKGKSRQSAQVTVRPGREEV